MCCLLPHTSFKEIYDYLRCPSRLYLKLSGFTSEIQRRYTPPAISPVVIGRQGEEEVKRGFLSELNVVVPEVKRKEGIGGLTRGFKEFVREMIGFVKESVNAVFSACNLISIDYSPLAVTRTAESLKKDFGVIAVIEKVRYTNVPHHYVGEIDFLGLKEDNEVIVIEVKNKSKKLDSKDFLQLEYYLAGLRKQYQFTKIHERVHELVAQLYPQKYLNYLVYMKKLDVMTKELFNIESFVYELSLIHI